MKRLILVLAALLLLSNTVCAAERPQGADGGMSGAEPEITEFSQLKRVTESITYEKSEDSEYPNRLQLIVRSEK